MGRLRTPGMSAKFLPFDLGSLHVFLTVCDAGGMGAAARILGQTQPAVSQTIADLERKLDVLLFDREARPLALTMAGGMLKQRALALIAEAHQVSPAIRETQRGKLPLIRVGLVDSLTRALTVPVTSHLLKTVAQVSIFSGLTVSHADGIINRNVDVSIGIDALEDMEGIERHPLIQEPFVLMAPKSVPGEAMTNLEALAQELPLVRYSSRSQTGREIDRHLRRLQLDIPRLQEFDTPVGVTEIVVSGGGWSITTPLCIFEGGFHPSVQYAALPAPGLSRKLFLLCRQNELARLPRELAEAVRNSLAADIIPGLVRHMPWAKSGIRIRR